MRKSVVWWSLIGLTLCGCRVGFEDVADGSIDGGSGAAVCGNGNVEPSEGCDDGNDVGDDGCFACEVAEGWNCIGAPSQCSVTCGDGRIVGAEQCDDGGSVSGDGCSDMCRIEAGWRCGDSLPSQCVNVCGDGIIVEELESCDDDNTTDGDGCSSSCMIEDGASCNGEPSECSTGCGDGALDLSTEECDDSNLSSGDGCSAQCQIEAGYDCTVEPLMQSQCFQIGGCGDGIVEDGEACDDGNTALGDGCEDCEIPEDAFCEPLMVGEASRCCHDPDGDAYGTGLGCLGADCDESSDAAYVGAEEVCDNIDNDCDGSVDVRPCYDGPGSAEPEGVCSSGEQRCVGQRWSSCIGQRLPAIEICNGLDDDCDGETDEHQGVLACGPPTCGSGLVERCVQGELAMCPEVSVAVTEICDGMDTDCNGLVDDTASDEASCGCYFPAQGGSSLSDIIYKAQSMGFSRVCLSGGNNCASAEPNDGPGVYIGPVEMPDGFSIVGGYDLMTRQQHSTCLTEIISEGEAPTIVFGSNLKTPTALSRVVVRHLGVNSADNVEAITVRVEGTENAIITDAQIHANPSLDFGTSIGIAVNTNAASDPTLLTLLRSEVRGSVAADTSIGIEVNQAGLTLRGCMESSDCAFGEGIVMFPTGSEVPVSGASSVIGIKLSDAASSAIVETSIQSLGNLSTGVSLTGDVSNVTISGNDILATGPDARGIEILGCLDSSPVVVSENGELRGWGDVAEAIFVGPSCSAVIQGNAWVNVLPWTEVGAVSVEAVFNAIACEPGAACAIDSNVLIVAEGAHATGIWCGADSCPLVTNNAEIVAQGGATSTGVRVAGGAFVGANVINGGCGDDIATGLVLTDSDARVENNFIASGDCEDVPNNMEIVGVSVVSSLAGGDVDVHSNTIRAGMGVDAVVSIDGLRLSRSDATKAFEVFGLYRNNLFSRGHASVGAVIREDHLGSGPAQMAHNHVFVQQVGDDQPTLYEKVTIDGSTASYVTTEAIDALFFATSTTSGDPKISDPPYYLLAAESPLIDTGGSKHAPARDLSGLLRDATPDIGCMEYTGVKIGQIP